MTQARKPLSVKALDVGHRARAPDRGEVALVAIVERPRSAPREAVARPRLRRVAPLLHRHRRHARQRRAPSVGLAHRDHVAEREHLGMPGQREVRLDGHASGAIELGAGPLGQQLAASGEAVTPAAQMTVASGCARRRRRGASTVTAVVVDPDDGPPEQRRDAEPLERARGLGGQRRGEGPEHAIGGLDEQDARRARVDRCGSRGEACRARLGDLARHLDPGRPGADDDERQPARRGARGRARARPPRTPRGSAARMSARPRATSARRAYRRHSSWPK